KCTTNEIAKDLYAKDCCGRDLLRVRPSKTVVGRVTDKNVAGNSIVVPGNVHSSVKWRSWVIVSPARFGVDKAAVNAAMSPAIGIPGCAGLIVTEARIAARVRRLRGPCDG